MHRIVDHGTLTLNSVAQPFKEVTSAGKLVLLLTVCVAGIASYLHAGTGAAQSFYVDEMFYDRYAMELAQWVISSEPVKFSYIHPSGYSMALAFIYGLYYLVGKVTGQFPDLTSFLVHFGTHRGDFVVLGRLLSATFAVATVPFLYVLARRLFGERVAAFSCLAFAVSYPVVFYAHIAANITMLMFLTAATMYFVVRVSEENSATNYVVAGALIGVAVGTKYYPGVLALPLLLAHFSRTGWKDGWRNLSHLKKLFAAAFAAGICAVIVFPLPLLAFDRWAYFMKDTFSYYTGGDVLGNAAKLLWGSVPYYAETAAEPSPWWSNSLRSWSETTLLWIGAGLLYAAIRFPRRFVLLFTPFLVMFLMLCIRGGLGLGVRQLYFAVPLLLILASAAFIQFVEEFRLPGKWEKKLLLIGLLVLLAQPTLWTVRLLSLLSRPTTVELGREWLRENLAQGSVLLCDGSAAPFGETEHWWNGNMPRPFTSNGIERSVQHARMNNSPFKVIGLKWKDARKECEDALSVGTPVYVVTTDYFFSQYWHPKTLDAWGNMRLNQAEKMRRYVESISSRCTPLLVIRPREVNAIGPTITISRLDSWNER